ncbi:unnamed protein product [Phyllotreta striolata]|uniref:ATP-dependent RNA helicase n=1 Tax=Phyllotreta striolata TaxID=444603 RepID=A0A9N9TCW7_PHYSR|nr:unnamed protein product [Phyllotreta striolata]
MIEEANWKPIPVGNNLFSEGLIGIEECTDYTFTKNGDIKESSTPLKRKKKTSNNNKKKQKIDENDFTLATSGNTSNFDESDSVINQDYTLDAWSCFGLPDVILRAIGELGFDDPTPIQSMTLPSAILGRRDIVGAAETGSGKTLAFALPILTGILKLKESAGSEDCKPLYALILTPTRELAIQVKNHIVAVAKYTGVNVAVVVGGMAVVKQERILSKEPEIVIATPGRLWELIQQGNSHLSKVDKIKYLAIDETDRMLEKGHFQELNDLLEKINFDKNISKERQNFVFSATLTLVHELPNYLKSKRSKKIGNLTPEQKVQKIVKALGLNNPKVVDITEGKGTSETLTESKITCSIEEKDYYLFYFLKMHPGRTVVFCNSIGCVKRLGALLTLLNCNPLPLHASMQQRQRLKNIDRFTGNENSILIATDVAARGLDIPRIDHVLHYQTPRTSENYVHRSGRTARASREGISVVFIEPTEIPRYIKLCRTLGKADDMPSFPVRENVLSAMKKRVNLARDIDKLQLQVKKAGLESGWLQKTIEEADIIADDFNTKYDNKEVSKNKKLLELKKKQLLSLLNMPIYPEKFNGNHPLFSAALSSTTDSKNDSAITLVKDIAPKQNGKKKNPRLFKPKKHTIIK